MANTDRTAVLIGVYYSCDQAEKTLDELKRNGFREDQLRVTLCAADLRDDPSAPRPPATKAKAGGVVGGGLGAIGGGFIGAVIAGLFAGIGPMLAAAFWTGLCSGMFTGAVLGAFLGAWIGQGRSKPTSAPAGRTFHLSRGIVAVRPHHRYAEAAAILRHFAGCDANPTSVVGL